MSTNHQNSNVPEPTVPSHFAPPQNDGKLQSAAKNVVQPFSSPESRVRLNVPGLGEITGWKNKDGSSQFFGIPYADIEARWRHSKLKAGWPGNKHDGTKLGRYAAQPPRYYPFPMPERTHVGESVIDELECCNLNVTVPRNVRPDSSVAVLVFFHGGAYTFGTANYSIVDGRYIAETSAEMGKPVIVVNVNYRLGWYGFLGSEDIKADNEGKSNGNFGIYDQRNALLWINEHITAFGGNKDKICIFGQSAGGISVDVFLHSPAYHHLFNSAIVMSGTVPICGVFTEEEYNILYFKLLKEAGIDTSLPSKKRLAALRAVPHEKLSLLTKDVFGGLRTPQFGPCDDGIVLGKDVRLPRIVDYKTEVLKFPGRLMIGDCKNEGIIYQNEYTAERLSTNDFIKMIRKNLPLQAAEATLSFYKIHSEMTEEDKFNACEAIITDGVFVGPAYYLAQNNRKMKPYVYHWDQVSNWDNSWGNGKYAHHSMDYMYAFGCLSDICTTEENALGKQIRKDFITFACGDSPYLDYSEGSVRVYGPNSCIQTVHENDYKNRNIQWINYIANFWEAFDVLCFEISMRRKSYILNPNPLFSHSE